LEAPRGAAQPSERLNKMDTIEQVKKAFHEARIAGEQLLNRGKITWDEYAATMVGFELILKEMGVDL
jgi:hypothetical protein